MTKRYDYIIAGAGCAGLSLAYHLNQSNLCGKSTLLIDRETKNTNDRTWCFWEIGENPFEAVVFRQWSRVNFYSTDFEKALDLMPYRYKMIRGLDFYRFVQTHLQQNDRIEQINESILSIEETANGARVITQQSEYHADWVFDSTYQPKLNLPQFHNLLQHFKGWVVETKSPVFDPQLATLMDFRIDQQEDARFFYVLPLDTHRALIEFTLFSEKLLAKEAYNEALRLYLKQYLQLEEYGIQHEEFGVIPMTDEKMPDHPSPHILRIGTAGGYTKASTGYTFLRIQEGTQALVQAMVETGKPLYSKKLFQQRFQVYDSVLLNVMQQHRWEARDIFSRLFRKNGAPRVFRFLDEATTFDEELKIMTSVPSFPFLAAVGDVLWRKVRF